jgi:membrane protein
LEPLGPKGAEITNHIIDFVGNLKVGVLGAVGVAGLFYTTFSLIDKTEESLNTIWRVRQCRPLTRKFTDYLSVVLVGPVLVFTAFAMTASAQSHWLVQRVLQIEPLGAAVVFATKFMPFVFLCLAFTFFFKLVPYTQVNYLSAMLGGVVAGLLWQLAGWAFSSFVAGATRYGAVYSSFASLIIFLIWLYVGWLIVLIGSQVAYYHQHPAAYLTLVRWKQNTHVFRERLVLSALIEMARHYYEEKPPYQVSNLAVILKVPFATLDELIEECVGYGIVNRTSKPPGIVLGRPPEQLRVTDILDHVGNSDPEALPSPIQEHDVVSSVLERRDQAIRESLQGVSLKTLAFEQELLLGSSDKTDVLFGQSV